MCPPSYAINVTSVDFYAEDKEFCKKQDRDRRLQTEWWIVEQEMKAEREGKKKATPEMHDPCEDPNLLEEVKAKCDGHSWCQFNISQSNYTHTCPDEELRFLNVSFSCSGKYVCLPNLGQHSFQCEYCSDFNDINCDIEL